MGSSSSLLQNLARGSGKFHFHRSEILREILDRPNTEQRPLSERFSTPRENRFENIDYVLGENGSPIFPESLAVFECSTHAAHEAGDHTVFICRVTHVHMSERDSALLFHKGQYHTL